MSKLRHLMVANTFILSQLVFASLEDNNYYPQYLTENIQTYSKDDVLKKKLREVISFYHEVKDGQKDWIHAAACPTGASCIRQRSDINYKEARRHLFGDIHLEQDERGNYFVKDKYCEIEFNKTHKVGPKRIPNSKYINCEHTWPQSRFNTGYSKSLQKNDLHHLYPVKSNANSVRSNIIFGEVIGKDLGPNCTVSRRGVMDYPGSKAKAFEPPKNHRGDVARAIFYFSVRYDSPVTESEEFYLRRWHKEDPISQEERIRNDKIFAIQKNRNPFVDDETLVDQIKDF
ncbi:MAG: hypothetical protein BM556_01030 [Bacteriovorax sp. MedPE-SWde]|nr:MAG: hypothetical protein BM556_01030 [Bacteriovorax sp. MedPE-SWde]